jgi:hypothetical protein
MPVPNVFTANTQAVASEVNANFDFFETLIDNTSGTGAITITTASGRVAFYNAARTDSLAFNPASSNWEITPATGNIHIYSGTHNVLLRLYGSTGGDSLDLYYDGTDGYINTQSGDTRIGAGDDIRLIPNSNGGKVTIGKMPRRANSSTTYVESFIQSGFVYVQGDGTNQITAVVTFPIAFSSDLVRVVASPGSQFGSAGDEGSGTTTGRSAARSYDIRATQTGLSLNTLTSTDTFASGTWYPIHWIAIGPL